MKLKLLIITTLFTCFSIFSQTKGDFEVGGNIGINISNVAVGGSNNLQTESKTGFNIAGSGEYYFNDRWGIKVKLIFDQKGWSESFAVNEFGNIVMGDMELNYLTIPIMANWHFGRKRNWYLNFGLYNGILLNAEVDGVDTKDFFKQNDFGLAAGIGVKFPVSEKAKLFLEYDLQSGFLDITDEGDGTSAPFSLVNGRSAFNFGVLFSL